MNQSEKLIELILDNRHLTYSDLSRELNLSRYKVSSLIDDVNQQFKEKGYDIQIEMIPYQGAQIKGELSKIVNSQWSETSDYQVNEKRKLETLAMLLNAEEELTIQYLSDQLFVSRTTFERLLQEVRDELAEYDIEIIGNARGLKIDCNEKGKRQLLSTLINSYKNKIVAKSNPKNHLDLSLRISKAAEDLVNLETVDRVCKLINEFTVETSLYLGEFEFSSLVIHTSIAVERMLKKFLVSNINSKEPLEHNTIILKTKVENEFGLEMPDEEQYYLNLHIKMIQQNNVNQINYPKKDDIRANNSDLQQKIYQDLRTINPDAELLRDLEIHLQTAVNRIKNHMSIRNPYLNQIKEKYFYAFELSEELVRHLFKSKDFSFTEDEIAYVAIHIQAFFERKKQSLTNDVLIVCGSGLGTAKLLEQQLKNKFGHQINIIDTVGLTQYQQNNYKNVTIISTIPINETNTPIINVKPIMDGNDFKRISRYLNEPSEGTVRFIDLIDSDLFITSSTELDTQESVIAKLISKAEEKEFISADFKTSVLNREKLSSTAIGRIAMPHGDYHYVKQSAVMVYKNESGIKWDKDKVYIVFMFMVNQEIKEHLSQIYSDFNALISSESTVNNLIKSQSYKEFKTIIREELG
ncbi:BglG family transcription antiterminator [Aerococcus sanguinicola]|uniref:BglG family transcription antiterminator n=1 Tax=unclassified Aerococcus TaxID=2618060 RepID=UPI0008A5B3B7|nr:MULTISPECIES: PTS sugar transporter subunit IIA [unclassified Aerococcus]KAB0645985.1 PRD domain-containing protein [Aerococcus sanguinicola]MDK6234268.1 PTS sugar transporter subunit IIA [Aerococcus sp. UMB10185]MDK6855381.1 PTS sugar transporter subunit IIA [Aerococcus sp. UMB7533]MDK8501558.1 PTS sugar transporter subunit IIA [Aerococcus sp. UMB1112A]OFN05444.1 hypothetical protein HMPREF2626_03290 [Aerococcus sp. HMSC062A02]